MFFVEVLADSCFRFENELYRILLLIIYTAWLIFKTRLSLFKCVRHSLTLLCFPLVTDGPQIHSKRGKEKEDVKNERIKKRKKTPKDYQPNYFLSVPITNKKVIVS